MTTLPIQVSGQNKVLFYSVGILLGFSAIFALLFSPPLLPQDCHKVLLDLTFLALIALLLSFNHYLSGTAIFTITLLISFLLAFSSLRFSSWELAACIPFFIWLQLIDRRKRNSQSYVKQAAIVAIEKVREKLRDKKEYSETLDGKRLALARQIRRFSNLRNYITQINLSLKSDSLFDMILNFTSENLPGNDIYTLSLLNKKGVLVTRSFIVRGQAGHLHLRPDQTDIFNDWVMTYRSPLTVKNTREDYRFQGGQDLPLLYPFSKSIIASPLISDDKPMGLIRVDATKANQFQISDFRFLVIIANISALSLRNAELIRETEKLSITDGLTGLYRPHFLFQKLNELMRAANEGNFPSSMSVLLMDLDHFKKINDNFGHVIGDQILIQSSRMINRFCPKTGYAIRYGGEEFALLLPGTGKQEATSIAENIRKSFIQKKTAIRRELIRLSLSIGVANFPNDSKDPHAWFELLMNVFILQRKLAAIKLFPDMLLLPSILTLIIVFTWNQKVARVGPRSAILILAVLVWLTLSMHFSHNPSPGFILGHLGIIFCLSGVIFMNKQNVSAIQNHLTTFEREKVDRENELDAQSHRVKTIKGAIGQLQHQLERTSDVYKATLEMSSTLDFKETLLAFVTSLGNLDGFENLFLIIEQLDDENEEEGNLMVYQYTKNRNFLDGRQAAQHDEVLYSRLQEEKRMLTITDCMSFGLLPGSFDISEDNPALVIPLYIQDDYSGVLVYFNKKSIYHQQLELLSLHFAMEIKKSKLYSKIKRLSIIDSLSGAYLKSQFLPLLSEEIEQHRQSKMPLALCMMDIDHFKEINDQHGHLTGDSVIKKVAWVIKSRCREEDLICRFGGDEFIIVLPRTNQEKALDIAERIRKAISELLFVPSESREIRVTISVGVALFPGHGTEKESLMEAVDKALYRAKQSGRNQISKAEKEK